MLIAPCLVIFIMADMEEVHICISAHKGNPEVRFEIKIDEDVYDIICMYGIHSKARGTKFVTGLQNNRDFDSYLGKGWDRRIINKQGDFVYVANGDTQIPQNGSVM